MDYLIHFNPNHDPKSGRFTYSKRDRVRANKKIFNEMNKSKLGTPYQIEGIARNNKVLRDATKDEKLQAAYKKMKNTSSSNNVEEPNWYDDEYTVREATKKFKKDWPDWDKDPTDNKMFDYYMEEASQKSKTYAKKIKEFEDAMSKDPWEKAYNDYKKEVDRVAREFAGKYADKNFQSYYSYGSALSFAIHDIMQENK